MIRFNKSAQDGWLQEQLFLQRSFVAALSQTAPFLISRLRVNRSLREIARYNLQEYLSLEKVSEKTSRGFGLVNASSKNLSATGVGRRPMTYSSLKPSWG
jgi:hypothetical protein